MCLPGGRAGFPELTRLRLHLQGPAPGPRASPPYNQRYTRNHNPCSGSHHFPEWYSRPPGSQNNNRFRSQWVSTQKDRRRSFPWPWRRHQSGLHIQMQQMTWPGSMPYPALTNFSLTYGPPVISVLRKRKSIYQLTPKRRYDQHIAISAITPPP